MHSGDTDHRRAPRTRTEIWRRLEQLLEVVDRQGLANLSAGQVEQLGRLYRATTAHLDQQRTFGVSASRLQELNRLVARGHAAIYGRPVARASGRKWWLHVLLVPQTVRRTWRYHLAAALLLTIGAVYGYFGAAADPDWSLGFLMGADERTPYATRDELLAALLHGREGEVGLGAKSAFAAELWQHNTRVALLAFFLGFAAGVPTALLVLFNGVMLGTYTYTYHSHGLAWEWWAWILPHGVTELGAIDLLAGGGLWIGHAVVAPGARSRGATLRAMRGDVIRLLALAFPMLLIAAAIESFVRQSGLGENARYAFAAVTLVLWGTFLGCVRPPRSALAAATTETTAARRAVPLPELEELLGAAPRPHPSHTNVAARASR